MTTVVPSSIDKREGKWTDLLIYTDIAFEKGYFSSLFEKKFIYVCIHRFDHMLTPLLCLRACCRASI